jgi:twitching motility protein PilT
MERIIKAAVERGASDLHIKAGDVFRARIDGRLVPMTKQALTPEQTRAIALRLIPNEQVRQRVDEMLDYCGSRLCCRRSPRLSAGWCW